MLKYIIIIALLIGAFWYFQPEQFSKTIDMLKEKIGMQPKTESSSQVTSEEDTVEVDEIVAPLGEGYCIIGESCQYVSEDQCPELLYDSRTLCEDIIRIEEEPTEPQYNYVGFPLDVYGNEYDCQTDSDCNFDNTNCNGIHCQCDYATGECYLR